MAKLFRGDGSIEQLFRLKFADGSFEQFENQDVYYDDRDVAETRINDMPRLPVFVVTSEDGSEQTENLKQAVNLLLDPAIQRMEQLDVDARDKGVGRAAQMVRNQIERAKALAGIE